MDNAEDKRLPMLRRLFHDGLARALEPINQQVRNTPNLFWIHQGTRSHL